MSFTENVITENWIDVSESRRSMNLPIDSIYFFMFTGWRNEVQSDRWHYARRWARHVPVVLVVPDRAAMETWATCEPEWRLENVEVLSIREHTSQPSFSRGLIQAGQIARIMRHRCHRRPLLWFYNFNLVFAYALLPAVARIYCGNENYFEFDLDRDNLDMVRAAIAISDKVICGSPAMLKRFSAETRREDLEFIPNGCDYTMYRYPKRIEGGWMNLLAPVIDAGRPIAVFAGNIYSTRTDFRFLHRIAERLGELHFVYAGPVQFVGKGDRECWEALLRRDNVTYLGFLDAADLPWLYRIADRGFMPYRPLPSILKNPIPLKALEMAAAGLPIVSSLMESLLAVSDAVQVARNEEEFVEMLRVASRGSRSPEAAARADEVCRLHDYDRLFQRALDVVMTIEPSQEPKPASLELIYEHIGLERTLWESDQGEKNAGEIEKLKGEIVRLNNLISRASKRARPSGAAPPPGLSLGQRALWHIPPRLAAWVPTIVKVEVKRIIVRAPPNLSWKRRILWHISPAVTVLVPASLKSKLKRSLRLQPAAGTRPDEPLPRNSARAPASSPVASSGRFGGSKVG